MSDNHSAIRRFRLKEEIGRGAFGVVYRAYDPAIGREVALKILRSDRNDSKRRITFRNEAKAFGALNHPCITTLFDVGLHNHRPYLVTEFINGVSLKKLWTRAVDRSSKLTLISRIARALQYIHENQIVHGDIKPSNIMILDDWRPKLLDFGIARLAPETDDQCKHIFEFGTPKYMSPEQLCKRNVDHRTDIFSLGVLAHEWLMGDGAKPAETADPIPSVLTDIIKRSMAAEPKNRYATAAEFADAVDAFTAHYPTGAEDPASCEEHQEAPISWTNQQKRTMQLLKQHPMFASLNPKDFKELAVLTRVERYPPGTVLFQKADRGDRFFILLKGLVSIVVEGEGSRVFFKEMGPGGCLGEMAVLAGRPRSATASVLNTATMISVCGSILHHQNLRLRLKIYRSLAGIVCEKIFETSNASDSTTTVIRKIRDDETT